jgi:hypothetical protein
MGEICDGTGGVKLLQHSILLEEGKRQPTRFTRLCVKRIM